MCFKEKVTIDGVNINNRNDDQKHKLEHLFELLLSVKKISN